MFVPFESLPKNARIWIFQSNRTFSEEEVEYISGSLEIFTNTWQRHGVDLSASFTIKYSQFIVLAVDENVNDVSGCSIDASVSTIKELESKLDVDLMNKLNVAFKIGENMNVVSMTDFQQYVREGKINETTVVFNNMVQSIEEFELTWEVAASNSWHKRFFNSRNL